MISCIIWVPRAQLLERRPGRLFVSQLERELYPAVASCPVCSVDDLKDRAAVFAGLARHRVIGDAAREVVHLLREAEFYSSSETVNVQPRVSGAFSIAYPYPTSLNVVSDEPRTKSA